MQVGLLNFNRRGVQEVGVPPVPPIGLEYLADSLEAAHHEVSLLDLCFISSAERADAICDFVQDKDVIGITLRNIGIDNYWDPQFFVPDLKVVVDTIKRYTQAPVVLGGQGFSIYPRQVLDYVGADFGITGPGERAFPDLLQTISQHPRGVIHAGQPDLSILHKRNLIDYDKYVANGGSIGIQTKVGCPMQCSFCLESKTGVQCRQLDIVIEELKRLLSRLKQPAFFYVTEAEFNIHLSHAIAFCQRIIDEELKFSWSTYLNTIPLTEELVRLMKGAGCEVPCISLTYGEDSVLKNLDTNFNTKNIRQLAEWFHKYDMPFTADILFGVPGETLETARQTIALLDEIQPAFVGMNFGVRLWANTRLGREVIAGKHQGKLYGRTENNPDLFYPIFYISDMRVSDFLKEVSADNPNYRLLGYEGFEGVNYKLAQ